VHPIPYDHWSAHDWVAHYAGPAFHPHRAEVGSIWDDQGRRLPGYAQRGPDGRTQVFHTGQSLPQRALQGVSQIAQRQQQTAQSAIHGASSLAHEGIRAAASTAPKLMIAGLAALGIIGWVAVQSTRTAGKTIRVIAPHVARTAEAIGPAAAKALPLLAV
jgi:hypothetical protein